MTRSQRSWTELSPAVVIAGAIMIATVGLWTELHAFGAADWRRWIPDYLVGIAFVAAGCFAIGRGRSVGALLLGVALAWWLANVVPGTSFWHRPLVALAIWTYPDVGTVSRRRLVVSAAVAASFGVPAIAHQEAGTAVFGVVVLVGAVLRARRSFGPTRRLRRSAVRAATAVLIGSVGSEAARLVLDRSVVEEPADLLYQLMLGVCAGLLGAGVRRPVSDKIADLVVELGHSPSPTVRGALAVALDDPGIELGVESHGRWLDADGRVVVVPGPGSGRAATILEPSGSSRTVIVHDESLLDDPALLDAVSSVARLWAVHAEFDASMRVQLAELAASRRRLLHAEDDERRRLAQRLRAGPDSRLDTVGRLLRAAARAAGDETVVSGVADASVQLVETRRDLADIGWGLRPRELDGELAEALQALAARSPLPVEVTVDVGPVASEPATVLFYCCAEAISNAVKHAAATGIRVDLVDTSRSIRLMITDDGVGGVDRARGTGITGLEDRVAVAGGTLSVDSPCGGGTRLVVDLPRTGPPPVAAARRGVGPGVSPARP